MINTKHPPPQPKQTGVKHVLGLLGVRASVDSVRVRVRARKGVGGGGGDDAEARGREKDPLCT